MDPAMDLTLTCFFQWCQHQVARFTMRPPDYALYDRLVFDYNVGCITHQDFEDEMGVLLSNYPDLRFWWTQVHHMEVIGGMRMVDNSLAGYPVVLCVMLNCLLLLGDYLWESRHNGAARNGDDA